MNRREIAVLVLLLAALAVGSVVSVVSRAEQHRRLAATRLTVLSPAPESLDDSSRRLDLNTATAQQLEALPGIGPVLAQRIISLRNARGGFHRVSELDDVSGIGSKKLAALQDFVTIESTATADSTGR